MAMTNCPFCAGDAIDLFSIQPTPDHKPRYAAACTDCGALGPLSVSHAHASQNWNMRMLSPEALVESMRGDKKEELKKDLARIFKLQ